MTPSAVAQAKLFRLRRDIARIEGRFGDDERRILDAPSGALSASADREAWEQSGPLDLKPRPGRGRFKFAIPRLDAALGGGLALSALHEVRAEESRDGGTAAGLVLALAICLAAAGGESAIVWVSEASLRYEAGRLYAPGLAALGLDPSRIVEVAARTENEALWAFEAALGCHGVGVAICELREAGLDLTATRRAALRARDCGVTGFLLRLASRPEPSAAEVRFAVVPAPAGTIGGFAPGVGRMAWQLSLEKNRGGPTGAFSVEWRSHERRFVVPGKETDHTDHPQSLSAATFDRQAAPLGSWRNRRYAS